MSVTVRPWRYLDKFHRSYLEGYYGEWGCGCAGGVTMNSNFEFRTFGWKTIDSWVFRMQLENSEFTCLIYKGMLRILYKSMFRILGWFGGFGLQKKTICFQRGIWQGKCQNANPSLYDWLYRSFRELSKATIIVYLPTSADTLSQKPQMLPRTLKGYANESLFFEHGVYHSGLMSVSHLASSGPWWVLVCRHTHCSCRPQIKTLSRKNLS